MLVEAGKGDGNIRYYEYDSDSLYPLSEYQSSTPQRGMCFLPRRALNVSECEIARAYKVAGTTIEPISFVVPRKVSRCILFNGRPYLNVHCSRILSNRTFILLRYLLNPHLPPANSLLGSQRRQSLSRLKLVPCRPRQSLQSHRQWLVRPAHHRSLHLLFRQRQVLLPLLRPQRHLHLYPFLLRHQRPKRRQSQ